MNCLKTHITGFAHKHFWHYVWDIYFSVQATMYFNFNAQVISESSATLWQNFNQFMDGDRTQNLCISNTTNLIESNALPDQPWINPSLTPHFIYTTLMWKNISYISKMLKNQARIPARIPMRMGPSPAFTP